MKQVPLALISGATSGIGRATALRLARDGYGLIITGRRQERLQQLAQEISQVINHKEGRAHGLPVYPLCFDIQNAAAVKDSFSKLECKQDEIAVLVNNAGLAVGVDPLHKGEVEDWDQMIDTNVKGLLYLTKQVLPSMIEAKRGHIVNIGSVAGRWVYPGGAVYCASKFAVRAISEGLRLDLLGSPIRVTNIEPGMVETDFSLVRFKQNVEKASQVYERMTPLSADDIAECVSWCLSRPTHVNIQELVVYPTDQATVGMVHRR